MNIVMTSLTALTIGLGVPAAAYGAAYQGEVAEVQAAQTLSPERRALALDALDLFWPQGEAEYVVNHLIGDFADMMLDTPISTLAKDFGMNELIQSVSALGALAEQSGADEDEEMPTTEQMEAGAEFMLAMFGDKTLREMIASEDEHFDERLSIVRDVLRSDLPPMFDKAEPKMRHVMAELFAERFTDAELAQLAAFADTEAGRKFVHTNWTASMEPTYYRAMFAGLPALIEGMPAMVEKISDRSAHLPPMFPETEEVECEEGSDCGVHEETPEHLEEMAAELEAEAAELRARAAEMRADAAEAGN